MPTLSQPYQDIAIDVSSASYDPYLSMDTPFFTDPSLRIAEDKTQPLPEFHSEDAPGGKMERLSFPPEVKFGDETPRILKTDSSPAEVKLRKGSYINQERIMGKKLDASSTEIRWQRSSPNLNERKSISLVSHYSTSEALREDLELKGSTLIVEV